jgi:RNA polymerase sigma factor (sigma-70 family)
MGDLLVHASWVKRIAADLVEGDLADDVAQDVWEVSIRRPPDDRSAPRAWLRTVVLNLVRSGYRRERRRQVRETAASLVASAAGDSPEEQTIRTELQRQLAEQILTLREPYRQAVFLRYVEDLSAAQIARRLHVPAGTVRRRLKVGLDRMRENLGAAQPRVRGLWARLLLPLAPASALAPTPAPSRHGWPGPAPRPAAVASGRALALGALVALPLIIAALAPGASPRETSRASARAAPAAARAPVFVPAPPDPTETGMRTPADPPAASPLSGAVEGRVLDTDGNGLPGATVTAWSTRSDRASPREQVVQADAHGHYRIPLPPGRYVLRATSPDFAQARSWLDLRGTSRIDLRLHRPARLVGRVVDRVTGLPQPGGLVTVTSRQTRARTAPVDAAGAFSVEVEPGRYRVSARRGPLFGVSEPVQARPAENANVQVALARTAAVHGRVLGDEPAGGDGLAGVTVRVRSASDRAACRGFQAHTTSADDGGYRLEGLPPCDLTLELQARGYVRRSLRLAGWTGSADRRLDARLAIASVLSGQVRDAAGAPVAGATIHYMEANPAGPERAPGRVVSDDKGLFEVDGLPPGDLWIVAQHRRGSASLGPEPLGAGERRRLLVKLGPPAWISGRVAYPDGAPVAGFSLQAVATRDDRTVGTPSVAVTGEDGAFSIGPLVAGPVSLGPMRTWFVVPRGPRAGSEPLALTLAQGEARGGVQLTVVRPEGRLQGMVTDQRGLAVAGATVDVFLENRSTRADFEVRAFTDDAGRFELGDLPAGTRHLSVQHPVSGQGSQRGVPAGSGPLTIRLQPASASARP